MKTKHAIMRLLRITEMHYANAVEVLGYQYVRHVCANCRGAEEYLTRTTAFWKWWMRHFDIRDEVFLQYFGSYTDDAVLEDIRNHWAASHQPSEVEGRIPDPAWQQMLAAIREEEDATRPVYSPKELQPCTK